MALYFCPQLRQMLTDFQNYCTGGFASKFAITFSLNIPPHVKGVATLPRETLRSENSNNLKNAL